MAQEIFYQVRRSDLPPSEAPWSRDMGLFEAIKFLHARWIEVGGPIRLAEIRPADQEFGPRRSPWEARLAMIRRMQNRPVGVVVAASTQDGKGIRHRIRKVKRGIPEKEPNFSAGYDYTDVSQAVQKAIKLSAAYDYGVRTNGLAYTRKVEGTSIYSQHSKWRNLDCLGNAADLCFPLPLPTGNDVPRQRRLVYYLLANVSEMQLGMIISERTYWSEDNDWDPSYYGGVPHVSHTHIEGSRQSGSVCW